MGDSNNPNILDKETVSICFFSFSWFLGRGKEGKRGGRVHRGRAQGIFHRGHAQGIELVLYFVPLARVFFNGTYN